MLTPNAGRMLVAELRRAGTSTSASILSVAFLVWGMLRVFWGLDTAFSVIYDSEAQNTLLDRTIDGFVVFATVAVAVSAVVTVEVELPWLAGGSVGWGLERGMLFVGLALPLLPMYYLFPDQRDMTVVEVLPGVLTATMGLTLLESPFSVYVALSSQSADPNVVLAFLVLLTWLYLSSLVVLVGAVVNVVTSNRSRQVNVRPVVGGHAFDSTESAHVRSEIVAALESLEERVENDERMAVRGDDGEVSLPSPNVAVVDAGDDGVFGPGPVGLKLYWFPRDADGDDGE